MSTEEREQRLRADLETLQALKSASTIFDFEAKGDPPDRYTVVFHGQGLGRDSSTRGDVEVVELHRCDLRLPYSYPERPPDIRWLTPVFHPNISFSGFLNLREIGLTWDQGLGLDVVIERLWDVARGAHANLDSATNFSARNWFAEEGDQFGLPVDRRVLRDRAAPPAVNVVRYQRRGVAEPPAASARSAAEDDVLYIGEDTPQSPPLASEAQPEAEPQFPAAPRLRRGGGDDDVLYIGDE